MARIAIGGFQHETNTFAPSKADYVAFEAGGGWPGVQYGEPLFAAVEGANIPAAGAIRTLRAIGHSLVATAWAAASPSAHVTDDAYARISRELLSRLKAAALLGAFHQLDYLTGKPSQCSFIEPGRSIYRELEALESRDGVTLSFTPGFPMAHFADCGMAVFGYGAGAKAAAERLRCIVADAAP